MTDIPVEIVQLMRDELDHDVILLRDAQGRFLPIQIGVCEAAAIWVRLTPEQATPYARRPWSHDLMHALLERLGAQLDRVVIDGFTKDTFYATLHIRYREQELVVDARPSDAIALSLRMPAPIFVNTEVMDEMGIVPEADAEEHGEDDWGELP